MHALAHVHGGRGPSLGPISVKWLAFFLYQSGNASQIPFYMLALSISMRLMLLYMGLCVLVLPFSTPCQQCISAWDLILAPAHLSPLARTATNFVLTSMTCEGTQSYNHQSQDNTPGPNFPLKFQPWQALLL